MPIQGPLMRFGILGPLQLGNGSATVTAARERTLLAVLLLNAGRVVAIDELVDAVWDEDPPSTARGQLQSCVSRLRRTLVAAGFPPDVLATDPAGYLVRTDPPVSLDAADFTRFVTQARTAVAEERFEDAAEAFRTALALWRGPALAAITAPAVRRGAAVLDEQRMLAVEDRFDVELRLGRGGDLLAELTELVERHPLRERLRSQLMLALRASGRPADALEVYRAGREILAGELGIEPGPRLRETHRQILLGEVEPLAEQVSGSSAPPRPAPRCLPRAIADFTGHTEAVTQLLTDIERTDPNRPAVHAIDGMAGSGKTTLAVHVATVLGRCYPDAHLFVDLHGHSEQSPLTPAAALATLLRQLGVPGERIPTELDDRVMLWRNELAHRRALVVLDNAASTAQVSPLLPSGPGCLVLVTSRRRLVGLDGVRPRSLTVLSPTEAVELLARIAGPERVRADPDGAAEVVRRCGYLPLAIRLAGARLAHRPRWQLADLIERLGTDRSPLAEFTAEHRRVADAFALSYVQVTPPAQRAFRLLGWYPGRQLDAYVMAALVGEPLAVARKLLDELVDAHLVETLDGDRYRLHDLVREYAVELATSGGSDPRRLAAGRGPGPASGGSGPERPVASGGRPDSERRRTITALLDLHLHACGRISQARESPVSRANFVLPPPPRPDLVDACVSLGQAWFDDRRPELPALVRAAFDNGLYQHCWQLARACWRMLYAAGHSDELIETHTVGLRAAEALGEDAAIATMRNYLASAYFRVGRYPEAIELMEVAQELRRRIGDRYGLAGTHKNLGVAYAITGRAQEALENLERALSLYRELDNLPGIADVLNDLGLNYLMLGRYEEALSMQRRQLLLCRQLGETYYLSNGMAHIGATLSRQGRYDQALRRLRVALRMKEADGNQYGVGELLNEIGRIAQVRGQPAEAVKLHRRALAMMLTVGDRAGECTSRNFLGRALLDLGETEAARQAHQQALRAATKIQFRYGQADALDGIAACLLPTDPTEARSYWTRALALFEQIRSPRRHEVRCRLAEVGRAATGRGATG